MTHMKRPNASRVPSSSLAESSTWSVLRWGLTNLRRCRASVSCDSSWDVVHTTEGVNPDKKKKEQNKIQKIKMLRSDREQRRPASLQGIGKVRRSVHNRSNNKLLSIPRGVFPPFRWEEGGAPRRDWSATRVWREHHLGFTQKENQVLSSSTYLAASFPCQEERVPPQEACSRCEAPGHVAACRRRRRELSVAERLRRSLKLPCKSRMLESGGGEELMPGVDAVVDARARAGSAVDEFINRI